MKYGMLLAVMAMGILCGCNKQAAQIGWEGNKPGTAAEQIAYDACTCVYSVIRSDKGYDGDALIKEFETVKEAGDEKLKKLYPTADALKAAFPNLFQLSEAGGIESGAFRNSACMGSIEKRIALGGFEYEEIKDLLARRCPIVEIMD